MRRRRLLVALGVLLALAGAGVLGDWYARNRGVDRLLGRIEAAEAAVNTFDRATLALAGRAAGGGPLPPEDRVDLLLRIAEEAERSSVEVVDRVKAVGALRFLPWHDALSRARDRYVAHAGLWLAYLEGVAADAEVNYHRRSPEIYRTYRAALAELRRAVPSLPREDFGARIDRLEPR